MAKKRVLCFFQHRKTKNWIVGIDKNGAYEYSPKLCDAMLFYEFYAGSVSTKEHQREYVQTRSWTPPRAKQWKPPQKLKVKSSAVSKKSAVMRAEKPSVSEPLMSEAVSA